MTTIAYCAQRAVTTHFKSRKCPPQHLTITSKDHLWAPPIQALTACLLSNLKTPLPQTAHNNLFHHIKHHCLIMRRKNYAIYCITPTINKVSDWQGCKVLRIGSGICRTVTGSKNVVDWINEIDCWGLTTHEQACHDDIKMAMLAAGAVNDISKNDAGDGEE